MSENNVSFIDFINELGQLLSNKSGKDASVLLKSCPPIYEIHPKQLLNYPSKYNIRVIPSEWRNIINAHIETRSHLLLSKYKHALESQSTCCKLLVQQLDNWNNWILPILNTFMNDLKKIAIQADISENIDRTSGCNLEEATHVMNRAFTSCLTNSNTNLRTSNMLGTYKMINILLSVHSYLNTLDLCKSLIGAVETEPDLASIERFPKSDQVTFHYYYGRMEFFKEKFAKAEEHLMKAFKLCHNSHKNNQKRILIYLIPILIYRGILPDIKVLSKHRALQKIYGPLLNAIYEADISKYNKLLDQHQDKLSKMHVLLMFERLRLMCLRNLCKKVYINLDKPKRLTFEQIHIALNCAGFECDEDEAVGVFSTMISKKYALGYVAYTHNLVMISEKVGFYRLPLPKP